VTRILIVLMSLAVGVAAWCAPSLAAEWPALPAYMAIDDPAPTKAVMSGPAWPKIPAGTPPSVLSPFAVEMGARYWYSSGSVNFGFTNNIPGYGDPTSTIDWNGVAGHSGEVFARIDYRPLGLVVKGLVGGGILSHGTMEDTDFLVGQQSFSDTSSNITGDGLTYGIIDFGATYNVPRAGVRFGAFVGYHYWHEKFAAAGLFCNPTVYGNTACGGPGEWIEPTNVAVMIYQPTWNALRLGGDAQIKFLDRWTLSADVAGVPYAQLTNFDSHLLRSDLGPAPNIIDKSTSGYGAEAEMLINYALTPHIDIGAGLRYWGLFAQQGSVQFGPSFAPDFPLRTFSDQRYGLLLQISGKL